MARELDSEILKRLQASYGAMSDGELQAMSAEPEDLTALALEVLRGEMARRNLEPLEVELAGREGRQGELEDQAERPGAAVLMTFNDAIDAREACKHLEQAEVRFELRDVSEASTLGGSFFGGPAVAMQVIVANEDVERAQKILRAKMKLFPLQEVEEADAPEDGAMAVVACFGLREDADEVAKLLEDAGVWHRVSEDEEGSAETEDAFAVEVREVDRDVAWTVLEKSMGMAEE